MQGIFNNKLQKEKRKKLRKSAPDAELCLWQYLRRSQILGQKFRRQYSVGIYVIDFYCPKLKLAIEVDGVTHITDEEIENDKLRQGVIEQFGIIFLRFKNEEVFHRIKSVIKKIEKKIEELMNETTPFIPS